MHKRNYFLGIHANPPKSLMWVYIILPFVLAIIFYSIYSEIYLTENPNGKIVPSFSMMATRMGELAFTLDSRTHTYLFWADTKASMYRFLCGLSFGAVTGLLLGMNIALFPTLQYIALLGIVALSFVPMMAILPILLIVVGIGDGAKITLIFLSVVFFITRDIYATTKEIPRELLVKARTLGVSECALVYRIVLPMIMPRLFETTRQSLGIAWWALIAGEGIAATEGLGYRIFLVRRYFDMAAIIPYVAWITILAFTLYYVLLNTERVVYPWKHPDKKIGLLNGSQPV
ncbi:MAG: ABC transporter permease subunit [Patescibacteria group bacterium]